MRIQATDTAWRPLEASGQQKLDAATTDRALDIQTPQVGEIGRSDGTEGASFSDLLGDALGRVNAAQQQADVAMERVATGDAEDLHEAMLAIERADIALRLTAQVTQKAIEAYKEVSRMQV